MKKSDFEKALKKFNKINGSKLEIVNFQKGYGREEAHYPFNTLESRSSLELGLDGNLYMDSTIYVMTLDFKVAGICPDGLFVEEEFTFWADDSSLVNHKGNTLGIDDLLSDLEDKFNF